MFPGNSRKIKRGLALLMGVVFASAYSVPVSGQPGAIRVSQVSTTKTSDGLGTRQAVQALGGQLAVFLGHEGSVNSAVFSPDGRQIITASDDGTARLWDSQGNLLALLRGHQGSVKSAVFSPDGKQILTASWDGTARLWDTKGSVLAQFRGHQSYVDNAVFSPNGSQILTISSDETVRLWDIKGNQLSVFQGVFHGYDVWLKIALFSPEGDKILILHSDGSARLWNTKGILLTELRDRDAISSVLFSPDGNQILTTSSNGTASLWDTKSNLLTKLRGNKTEAITKVLSFSPDGQKILTASGDKAAHLWDTKGNLLAVFQGRERPITSAVFSPDGRQILTASWERSARLWDIKGNLLAEFRGHEPEPELNGIQFFSPYIGFSPDGSQILTAGNQIARLWGVSGAIASQAEQTTALQTFETEVSHNNANVQLAVLRGHENIINRAVFSPDGRQILTISSQTARLWDTKGTLLTEFQKHEDIVTVALFSPDGRQILTISSGTARLWDTKGTLLKEFREGDGVMRAVFSPDGSQILTVNMDDTTSLWDSQGNFLRAIHKHNRPINSAVFSPDGSKILTASWDQTARVWNIKGDLLVELPGHEHYVTSAEFSPDGNQIVTVSENARLWDSKGNLLAMFQGEDSFVNSAEFSPDGKQILTVNSDGTVRLWDTKGNLLIKFQDWVSSAVFSPDGKQILTASHNNTARLWDTEGNLLAVFRGHERDITSVVFSPDGHQILTGSWDQTVRLWDVSVAIAVQAEQLATQQAFQAGVSQNNAQPAAVAFQEGIKLDQQGTVESRQLAIQKLEEALELYRADKNYPKEAQTLLSIGNIHANLGQFQTALDSYNQALPLSRQSGAKAEEAAILNSLGQFYNDLADPKTALNYYQQALPLWYQLNKPGSVAATLNNIAEIQVFSEELQTAIKSYNQALIVSRYGGDLAAEATAMMGIGNTYIASKEWQTALNAYNQSLIIARYLKDQIKETTILNQLGKINAASGQITQAQAYYNQALPLSRQLGYKTEEARILYNQAILNRQQNNLTAAQTEIETAIKIVEELRTQIGSQELRQSYFAQNQEYYQFYIDLLMELHQQNPTQGYNAQALHISERARARSLIELLTEANANIRQGVDPQLLAQEKNLQQQLNDLDRRKYELTSGQYSETELTQIKQNIDNLLNQLNQVAGQIRITSPRYANLKYPQPLTLQQIQQQVLDEDTILLEYTLGKDRSYLWAITKNSINSYQLPTETEIKTAAETFIESVSQNSTATLETGIPLSQILLTPVANQLGKKRLLIVGDGVLQYIPFAALPIPTSPTTPLLVQNEIVTLPSASTISIQRQQLQNRTPAAKTLAVLADPVFNINDARFASNPPQQTPKVPDNTALNRAVRNLGIGENAAIFSQLPFTRTEAEKIMALVPKNQGLEALDFNASRTQATNPNLAEYQIVHFATHGLLDSVNPELSGIVLSLFNEKGESQDGFLRLHDIFNLNLPAELVVLSACKTGLGENVKGEGIVGLTRGFMYAGAKRVVVSLWSVNDSATSELMSKFYQKMLQGGQNPVKALREAQLEMWNSGQSPYFWGAFTVQGDWR